MRLVTGGTLFVSAVLLFWLQLMVGRLLLPRFGGTPAVWTTCLVFSQAVLLLGYLYAHAGAGRLGRWGKLVHVGVVLAPAVVLPVHFAADWVPPPGGDPVPTLLAQLLAGALLPMFALSASAPLLQRWFAAAGRGDPYPLYAASNLGSLAGLLGYPLGVEPALDLQAQGWAWAAGYALFAVLTLACAAAGRGAPAAVEPENSPPLPEWERARWVALSAVPAALLQAVTTSVTTEIAPVPLLWVLPLGVYLFTFVVAFGGWWPGARRVVRVAAPVVAVVQLALLPADPGSSVVALGVRLLAFGLVALALHDELAGRRPPAGRLTEFYLWLAVGGVAGGLFSGLLAPLLFPGAWEYPIALVVAAGLAVPGAGLGWATRGRNLALAAAGVAGVLAVGVEWGKGAKLGPVLARERNAFGVVSVRDTPTGEFRVLFDGGIVHGAQYCGPKEAARRTPRTYYHPTGPAGDVFEDRYGRKDGRPVAAIGLGAGALAAYAEPGEEFRFFEINPAVVRLARDPRYFTYLSGSRADCSVVLGDARLSMAAEPDGRYALVVVDAFGGDAVPVHLVTREAVGLYRRKSAADGVLAFHVSNTYLDLVPVLGDVAADLGLACYARHDADLTPDEEARLGKKPSVWVVMAGDAKHLHGLPARPGWARVAARPGERVWTDQYSNVVGALRW